MNVDLELMKIVMEKVRDDPSMDNVKLHKITWDNHRSNNAHFVVYGIKDFREDEIRCAFIVLYDAGLLSGYIHKTTRDNRKERDVPQISGLTSKGYDFLRNLEATIDEEKKTVYEKIKTVSSKFSIDVAMSLAKELAKKSAFQMIGL